MADFDRRLRKLEERVVSKNEWDGKGLNLNSGADNLPPMDPAEEAELIAKVKAWLESLARTT